MAPKLDERAVRSDAVALMRDKLFVASDQLQSAAQRHGESLTGPTEGWREASAELVQAKERFRALLFETFDAIGEMLEEAAVPVVHSTSMEPDSE